MNSQDDLKTRFSKVRNQDQATAPLFGQVLGRRRRAAPLWIAVTVPTLLVALAFSLHLKPPADTPPLLDWSSPTAFLLETPGGQLLRELPKVGNPNLEIPRSSK
jgi:hypothetical protein